jgi:hypothetical protein
MQSISTIFRLLVTWLLLSTMVDLSRTLGMRIASLTAPIAEAHPFEPVQTRRHMMDRLATARVRAQSDRRLGEHLLIRVFRDAGDPEIRHQAGLTLLELAVNDWPRGYRQDFLTSILPAALESAHQHRLPPSVVLAQAIQESGWGRSQLAKHHQNLFGIKAGSHPDAVPFPTLEVTAEGVGIKQEQFRRFDSAGESIQAHGALLSTDPRYQTARQHGQNWRPFLKEIAPIYASDPMYAARITQLIRQYKLDSWDGIIGPKAPTLVNT